VSGIGRLDPTVILNPLGLGSLDDDRLGDQERAIPFSSVLRPERRLAACSGAK
jgi:hypothetical protein